MSDILKQHIRKFIKLSDEDFAGVLAYFVAVDLDKKQNLHVEGRICNSNSFVVKGCLRMFFVNEKGVEQTIQFALEHWWLADYISFSTRQPSEFYIQAVEKSNVLTITAEEQEKLLTTYPIMERYFRLIHQRAHAAAQFRIKTLYNFSREQMYHQFASNYPDFVQRIPQYLLASFLGFTPEYLSEIRSKRIS
ncbi:Crp/Fnr family transcriptional regulator [Segetibacter sp. 3557_3]|uniref:Crp/Fnr family transcriptional regulator n=1 Tax=Segetibacter sp. 3557_3 TaxID=2547429 RepID=UPI001058EFB8|nr:Crp/Fnr family transcriptional regulator [Segetibacter sp. 3557_3]TDH28566.1 Crp/Fnr family transcriptional regulator [Segetibacter sp. 3557_3]